MRRIQKVFWRILCIIICTFMLGGCKSVRVEDHSYINLYATFYPVYSLTAMLTEGVPDMNVSCLVQPQDGCLRNYELSEWDLVLLARSADAIIAGGEGLESFESTLIELANNGIALSEVSVGMDLYTQEAPESDDEDIPHIYGQNPHIYMKTEGAIEILNRIEIFLELIDPEHTEVYNQNLESAKNRLESLRAELLQTAGDVENIPVVLMNEALIYVAQEYGLEVAGWIDRESGEAPDALQLESWLESLDAMDVEYILIEKQAPSALIQALKDAGYTPILMDVLSTVHANAGYEGYFSAMRFNANALKAAISGEDLTIE